MRRRTHQPAPPALEANDPAPGKPAPLETTDSKSTPTTRSDLRPTPRSSPLANQPTGGDK